MPPQHLSPVIAAGFYIVLLDQVPDDLLQRDSAGREMQARKRSLLRIVVGDGEHVEVAARIWKRGIPVVLVGKQRTRVVQALAGLVGVRGAGRCQTRCSGAANGQR